ncbi:hypothetical protein [Cytobacillus sp. FSL R5-0596]|uniref:hypothetical protein n=1 Tax=Cytobacillus sp. FSL R5-0596 TaxID=2954696 RepID=UPI00135A981A|nr:hypothetical protein KIS4809_5021 [Bacillus sp. ZZV12-4809]
MFKKVRVIFVVISLSLIMAIIPQDKSFASDNRFYTPFHFKTQDGKWDGKGSISNGATVHVYIYPYKQIYSGSDFRIRLCSASSGKCTSYKTPKRYSISTVDSFYTSFYSMYGGTYYVDVIDYVPGSVEGQGRFIPRY